MKRDDDYLRQLLFEFEESEQYLQIDVQRISMSAEHQKRHYHIALLHDAGLTTPISQGGFRLTNQGHDFIAAIRDDTIWSTAKEKTKAAGLSTLSALFDVALAIGKERLRGILSGISD